MNLSKPIPVFFKWKDMIRQIYWVIPAPLTSKHCYPIMSTLLYIEMQSEKALMLTRNNIQFWLDQILSLKKKKSSQGIYCLLKIPHQVRVIPAPRQGGCRRIFTSIVPPRGAAMCHPGCPAPALFGALHFALLATASQHAARFCPGFMYW